LAKVDLVKERRPRMTMARPLKAPDPIPAEVEFLRTEVRTGLTLSAIALRGGDKSRVDRNRVNARKVYDALLHFIPKVPLTSEEAGEINVKLAELKSELRLLGEDL
jgi:hypothetical protein